jgi:hypothetical protein
MPVTKKQKLNDNQVVRRRERRDDPGPPIGGLPGGDDMWVIVRSDDTDSENDLQEDEARAREAASRVVPLQLPSTPPSFALSSPSSSSSSQQGVKRKARPREDTVMDSDSGSDSSFALTSSSSSSKRKSTSKKKKKKKKKHSSGRSSTSRRTVTVAAPSKRSGKFVFDPDRDYKHYCEFDRSKCDYATDHKSNFNQHKEIHNDVRHACSKCDKTFARKSYVHTHIRVVHENQKNFPCKEGCGKMFISKYKQNEHYDFHHNNMAWTCSAIGCFFQCENKSNCRAHIKRMHNGEGEASQKKRT